MINKPIYVVNGFSLFLVLVYFPNVWFLCAFSIRLPHDKFAGNYSCCLCAGSSIDVMNII